MRKLNPLQVVLVLSSLMILLLLGCSGGSSGGSAGGTNPDPVPPAPLVVSINYLTTSDCNSIEGYFNVLNPEGSQITTLENANLDLFVDGTSVDDFRVEWVDGESVTIHSSVVFAMDYSNSMKEAENVVSDMENAVKFFIRQMAAGDAGEIIKFASLYDVIYPFPTFSDFEELENAVVAPPTIKLGIRTNIYDTLWAAIEDAAKDAESRKSRGAIILLTDGAHNETTAVHTIDETIAYAQSMQVPIYTIGLNVRNPETLKRISSETSGIFFEASCSADFLPIYTDISEFRSQQYRIIVENQVLNTDTHDVRLVVKASGLTGESTKVFTASCTE